MESFYIITNQLKDRDYSVTIEVKDYIERKGKRVILAQKDEDLLFRERFRRTLIADWF